MTNQHVNFICYDCQSSKFLASVVYTFDCTGWLEFQFEDPSKGALNTKIVKVCLGCIEEVLVKGLNLSRRPKFTKIVNPECKVQLNMLLLQLCSLVLVWTPELR